MSTGPPLPPRLPDSTAISRSSSARTRSMPSAPSADREKPMSLLTTANRISLRGRVIGGFGLLIVLIAGTSVFYDAEISGVGNPVANIEHASTASDSVGDFARTLLEVRRIIVDYVRSGAAAD